MQVTKPDYPTPGPDATLNIAVGIILTIVSCGLFAIYWQYKQISALNQLYGRKEFDFLFWFALSFVTCGLFGIYYEYKMADGINEVKEQRGLRVDSNFPIVCLLLTLLGFYIVSMALQQNEINTMAGRPGV